MSLENRFHKFIVNSKKHEDVDCLDELFERGDGTQCSKPDYFLYERSIIVEKKTLKSDPSDKVNKYLNVIADRDPDLNNIWRGTMHVNELINRYPDSNKLRELIMDKAYKGLRNDVMGKANKQLRKASDFLGFHKEPKGLLILNELVSSFEHEYLVTEAENNILRIKTNGHRELDAIDFILIISETINDIKNREFPCSMVIRSDCNSESYIRMRIERSLIVDWSIFNKRPIKYVK